uniref:Uncharacterized protein n=1 Tax=viral metagenome TaxID=1070528 RepID=A0A6C0JYG9_9ZZZZ
MKEIESFVIKSYVLEENILTIQAQLEGNNNPVDNLYSYDLNKIECFTFIFKKYFENFVVLESFVQQHFKGSQAREIYNAIYDYKVKTAKC